MWRRGQLSNRILASVVAILVATTAVGFVLDTLSRRSDLEHEYQRRALVIGQTFAAIPRSVRRCMRHNAADRAPDPGARAARCASRPALRTSSSSTGTASASRIPIRRSSASASASRWWRSTVATTSASITATSASRQTPRSRCAHPTAGSSARSRPGSRRTSLEPAVPRAPDAAPVLRDLAGHRHRRLVHARSAPEAQHLRSRAR